MEHPRAAKCLGVLGMGLLALGFWQGVAALRAPASWQTLRENLSWPAFLAGRTTAAVNGVMASHLPADGALRAAGGLLRWEVFGSGGPQVAAGCAGWLFLTEELRPWPGGEAAIRARARGVLGVAAALRARGIALAVAVSPDKAAVTPEHLCGARLSAQAASRAAIFTAALRAGGLEPIDLLTPLRDAATRRDVYYRTDSHWNPDGALIAAQTIGASLASLALPRIDGIRTETPAAASERPGDLLRLMSLESVPDAFRPKPDLVRMPSTVVPAPELGLLDEAPAPAVVLLGSSFSLNSDFHGELQRALRARVANFALAGGGAGGSAAAYFQSKAWRESPPKLVVWEVLGRGLTQPITEAEEKLYQLK